MGRRVVSDGDVIFENDNIKEIISVDYDSYDANCVSIITYNKMAHVNRNYASEKRKYDKAKKEHVRLVNLQKEFLEKLTILEREMKIEDARKLLKEIGE